MATNREKLMGILAEKFPKMWMKTTEEFNGHTGGIWTGEGSSVDENLIDEETNDVETFDVPIFNFDADNTIYEMGVHKSLVAVLDEHGWFAEWYDSGTIMIYIS